MEYVASPSMLCGIILLAVVSFFGTSRESAQSQDVFVCNGRADEAAQRI
jgi:hypothetical protein